MVSPLGSAQASSCPDVLQHPGERKELVSSTKHLFSPRIFFKGVVCFEGQRSRARELPANRMLTGDDVQRNSIRSDIMNKHICGQASQGVIHLESS